MCYEDEGMSLLGSTDATIINPTVVIMFNDGIDMANTYLLNATVTQNTYKGIIMTYAMNVCITTMHVTQSSDVSVTSGYISIVSSSNTTICNSSFAGISAAPNAAGGADPATHPAVVTLYDSSVHISECNFTGNRVSALKRMHPTSQQLVI